MRHLLCLLFLTASLHGQTFSRTAAFKAVAAPAAAANTAPSITANPSSVTCITNTTTSFTVTASGTAPLSYQWTTNTVNVGNNSTFAGATSSTLWVSNVTAAVSNLSLACVVTNAYGSATSSTTVLTVTNGTSGSSLAIAHVWKTNSFAGTSVTLSSISPTAGNLLVLVCASDGKWVNPPSDNINGTNNWVLVTNIFANVANYISMYYLKNCPSGITSMYFTNADYIVSILHEVQGASTTAPFTSSEVATLVNNSGTTNPQVGPVTNGTAASIFFAGIVSADPTAPCQLDINGTGSVGTWNLYSSTLSQELDSANNEPVGVANIIISSSTAETHGWTTRSARAAAILAAFH